MLKDFQNQELQFTINPGQGLQKNNEKNTDNYSMLCVSRKRTKISI